MNRNIAEVKDLTIKLGGKTILDNIHIDFQKEESVLIAGRNGAGKSTFLKCLADVILADRGSIVYQRGMDKGKVGFISDKVSLLENLTIRQSIDFHSSVYNIRDFDYTLTKQLNLDLKHKIKYLSAGERVLFHLSLLVEQKPEILLVDEIIHTIDPYLRAQFLETVIDLMDRNKTTVIMVNHTFSEVEKIPERILLMEQGRFILDEKSESLRKKIKVIAIKSELPQEIPCIFKQETSFHTEYFIYPFKEEFRTAYSYEYKDLSLNEIMKAFIGGQYVK